MKKTWKIFWIVCAVLAAVGIFLAVAGAALGGLVMLRDYRDENSIHRWIGRIDIGEDATTYSDIEDLDIELTGMAVCVQPYDETEMISGENDSIIVDVSQCREDLKNKIHVYQNGAELKVKMEKGGRLSTQDSGIIYISVPREASFGKISAHVQAGFIELYEVDTKELSVKTDAGEITADSFSAERLEAECGAGRITLNGEVADGAKISCDIGEVICTFPEDVNAYDYEVECRVGEVLISGESYSGLNRKIEIDNESGCKIEADCDMGRIEIMYE